MYYLNQKTLCPTSNPALGSAKLPFMVKKNERAPPYLMPLFLDSSGIFNRVRVRRHHDREDGPIQQQGKKI